MQRLLRHKLLVGLVAVLALAGAGAAYAATQSGTNPQQALLNDVAKRLHVSPAQLRSALQGALLDRLEAAVKAGRITQAQANRLKQGIERGALPFFGRGGLGGRGLGPRAFGPAGFGPGRFGPRGFGPRGFGPRGFSAPLSAATKYLGISLSQLLSDMRGGKTLAQVAQAQGKSVSGLEQAIIAAQKARLDALVASGALTKAQEQRRLSSLATRVDNLVEHAHISLAGGPPGSSPGPAAPPMRQLFQAPSGPPQGGPGGPTAGGPAGSPPPTA